MSSDVLEGCGGLPGRFFTACGHGDEIKLHSGEFTRVFVQSYARELSGDAEALQIRVSTRVNISAEHAGANEASNDALYTDTTLALNPDTGQLVWHYQHHAREVWDLDWAFERTVMTLPTAGGPTQDAADALFATDNYKAGVLIGQYTKAAQAGKPAKIVTLDLFPGHPVGAQRHNGFMKGFGLAANDAKLETTLDALRAELPEGAIVGGAPAENLDLQSALNEYLPIVVSVILVLGFLLLLIALQAPLIALLGTVVSLLSTGAAFGVAKLIFQDGHGSSLLGFTPQGFLNGWGPVFFFAMIFAIAMDYTVFLLASAKEHYAHSGDPRDAMVGSLAHSGRVIFAAGAVMVAVFFTFALSDPLPPKEMGIILGVAVLLDAFLIRLILLPVLLRLSGHAAWWAPGWLRRMLPSISFSH